MSLEPLGCVLPDRLEHPETLPLSPEQALVDQRLERVDVRFADLLGRLERAAAAEDRQAFEQEPLLLAEEVVAPFDRRAQRLLAGIDPAAGLEQVEPFGETVEQLLGGKHGDAGGRELEGEREVVELRAKLFDDRAGLEPRIGRPRPGGEELGRIKRRERRDRICLFARKPQQLPARHEELKVRTGGKQPSELRCCIDQMLEVVEDEQKPTVGDAVREAVPGFQRLSG